MARAERCQFEQSACVRPLLVRWARGARFWLRRALTDRRPVGPGEASIYRAGDWVRVKDPDAIKAMLDEGGRLRGLRFTDRQWSYCGGVYEVDRVVRRIIGDDFRMARITGAVVLKDVTCDGLDGVPGCGYSCALIFKDEWLEPAAPPEAGDVPVRPSQARMAVVRVKSADEILRTLGIDGRLDGISPSPEMLRLAGRRFAIDRRLEATTHWEVRAHGIAPPRDEWYVLRGVRCSGEVLGRAGPCDRRCGLTWHRSWLRLESGTLD
jgi:hypothetical protein